MVRENARLTWGGWDGTAFLAGGRNSGYGAGPGSSKDLAGGRVGLTWGLGPLDARLGVGLAFSRLGLDELCLSLPFDILGWTSALQAGLFHWKDNPDAAMLGEYLARYRSYPPSIHRQGQPWDSLGGMHGHIQGLRFAVATPRGAWKLEAMLLADSSSRGDGYDFSAAYTLDVRLPRGFEIGVGLESLGFATTQDRLRQPARGSANPYLPGSGSLLPDRDSIPYSGDYVEDSAEGDTVFLEFPDDHILSARVALDLRVLFGREAQPDRSGRIFLEAAILGWHDIPFYYRNRMDRLIWTAGTYLPSFDWLDVLCLQIEYQRLGRTGGAYVWNGDSLARPAGEWGRRTA